MFTIYWKSFCKITRQVLLSGMICITISACNIKNSDEQIPSNYIEHRINLKNDLGELTIKLPSEFDTTYSWTNYSDYYCGDREMFRIANKNYTLLQENGAFYNVIPDSLYQMTIEQLRHIECGDSIIIDNTTLESMTEKYIAIYSSSTKIFVKELRRIHERDYLIIGSNLRKETRLNIMTAINGHYILIDFIYQGKQCGQEFVDKINKSLNTIKISTPF